MNFIYCIYPIYCFRFLVGAPKADVDAQRYTQQKDLVLTRVKGFGSLYKCKLSTNPNDCERLKLGEESEFNHSKLRS